MKQFLHHGRKALYLFLALPLLLSTGLFAPLAGTQRTVLVEDWSNTG